MIPLAAFVTRCRRPPAATQRLLSTKISPINKPYPPLSQAPTLPAKWYRCPEQYEKERKRIFWTQWHCIGSSSQLNSPREYITDTIAGWPIIVQRARKAKELSEDSPTTTLRAYHNVCRHRAGPLALPQETISLTVDSPASGISPVNGFRCKYHGWTYSESGAVAKACGECSPAALPEFDRGDMGLYPVEVREEMGLIFVRLHCERAIGMGLESPISREEAVRLVPTFEEQFADAIVALREVGLEDFKFHSMKTHELKCNWKTYVDNYSEGYHIFCCHENLNNEISAQGDYRVEVSPSGRSMRHVVPLKEESEAETSGVWVFAFPNIAFNVYGQGISVERMVPLTPTTMAIKYIYAFKDGTDEATMKQSIAGSLELTEEDREIAEQVQRNLDSGIYTASRYSPRHENGLYAFHKGVWEACA
eukprot:jgi/Bigna1/37337/e_gw1.19.53.1